MRFPAAAFFILMFASYAFAAPSLFGSYPANSSFVKGGRVNFTINATGSGFDTSTARLFLISRSAYQQAEPWDIFTMQCSAYADSWICSKDVSFAITGSDTEELFYFEANDTSGTGVLANSSHPMTFVLDRNPPSITFIGPANNSYVSGNVSVSVSTGDTASGVNSSSIQFSLDNSTWNNITNDVGIFNSTVYANNQSVIVYVRVSDKVGNNFTSYVNVTVDNELPSINITSPQNNSAVSGLHTFSSLVSDMFSNVSAASLYINGDVNMVCLGNNCTATIDTSTYADKTYNITYKVSDKAGNQNSSSISVTLKNSKPTVTLSAPTYAGGTVTLNATVTKPDGIITKVTLSATGYSADMSCNSNFTFCTKAVDTKIFADGAYAFTATAANTLGYDLKSSANLNIDNTKPSISISSSDIAKGIFQIQATVKDVNPAASSVTFKVTTQTSMPCTQSGTTLTCTAQYDTSTLDDGQRTIEVKADDLAGNSLTGYKNISVDNKPPEFIFIKIEPIKSGKFGEVNFTVGLVDKGSSIKSAKMTVKIGSSTTVVEMSRASTVWHTKLLMSGEGIHSVEIEAIDASDNRAIFSNVGYFLIGSLLCGDSVCQPEENYCICNDCSLPGCPAGQGVECGSGQPLCKNPVCGDSVCSSAESCSTCSSDCGTCEELAAIKATAIGSEQENAGVDDSISNFTGYIKDNMLTFITVVIVVVAAAVILLTIRKQRKEYKTFLR